MEKKVSIIIPVFNVEQYLPRCIKSVLNQTYKNLQIILVDDGSTDESGKMCDEFAMQDNRIFVIHQKNHGVSSARNEGLKHINGEYFMFVDADDEVLNNTIETVMKTFESKEIDSVFFRVIKQWENSEKVEEIPMQIGLYDNVEVIKGILSNYADYGGGYPWNKVWHWSSSNKNVPMFDSTLFYFEDLEWVVRMLKEVKHICLIPEIGYKYLVRDNSTTCQTGKEEQREFGYHCSILKAIESLDSIPIVKDWFLSKYRNELVNGVIHAKMNNWEKVCSFLSNEVYNCKREIMMDSRLTLKIKIRCLCIILAKIFHLI